MSSPRVLIASGDEAIREVLGSILRADGYEVLAVASTSDAISQAARFGPDTLIIEAIMPGEVDGLRAAKRITQETKCKVLFLESMHDLSASYSNALRQEIPDCDILPMPFEKDEVLAIVHSRVTRWSIAERRSCETEMRRKVVSPPLGPRVVPGEYKADESSDWWAGAVFCVLICVLLTVYIALVFYAPHKKTLTAGELAALKKPREAVARVIDDRIAQVKLQKDAKEHDFKALESDGQLMTAINAAFFEWSEVAATSPALRIEPRGGNNLIIYLRNEDFDSVPYPDREEFNKAIGKAWCDNTGKDSHWLLPSVYMEDIRTGEELARYSCVFD